MEQKILAILEAGHGGSDPGAVANGIVEKDANLDTTLALRDDLLSKGIAVEMIRVTDVSMSLEERVSKANEIAKRYPGYKIVYISVHHNAGRGDRGEYIHSIFRGVGQGLAESIGNEMLTQLGQQKKVYEKVGAGNKDYYFVIRNTTMDAIIVEVCFLDNAEDVQIADTLEERRRNGRVIGDGVSKYFGITASSAPTPPPVVTPPAPVKPDVLYRVYIGNRYRGGRWLPWVKNTTDYAGLFGHEITAVECKLTSGDIIYRTSSFKQNYYPWVKNTTDYAGDMLTGIDRFQIQQANIRYRVHTIYGRWLPHVVGLKDYAGIIGQKIDGIEIEVI